MNIYWLYTQQLTLLRFPKMLTFTQEEVIDMLNKGSEGTQQLVDLIATWKDAQIRVRDSMYPLTYVPVLSEFKMAEEDRVELLKMVLPHIENINAKGLQWATLIHYAIQNNYLIVTNLLLAQGADPFNAVARELVNRINSNDKYPARSYAKTDDMKTTLDAFRDRMHFQALAIQNAIDTHDEDIWPHGFKATLPMIYAFAELHGLYLPSS